MVNKVGQTPLELGALSRLSPPRNFHVGCSQMPPFNKLQHGGNADTLGETVCLTICFYALRLLSLGELESVGFCHMRATTHRELRHKLTGIGVNDQAWIHPFRGPKSRTLPTIEDE